MSTADDPPMRPPMNPSQGNNIKNFLLTQDRKRELYETTILNIDRTINDYMQTKLTLKREILETEFLAKLKSRPFVEDEEVRNQINELHTWIEELKELKQTVMMNWLQLEQGATLML